MITVYKPADIRPLAAAAGNRLGKSPQATIWLTLALVFMLSLLANYSYTSYRQAEAEGEVMTRNLVSVLESRLSSDFAQSINAAAFLARSINEADLRSTISANQQAVIRQQIINLETSFTDAGGLFLFDAEGTLRHSSEPKNNGINIADRPHFQFLRADATAETAFSEAQIGRTTGKWSIVAVRALRDERGRFLGTANAAISLESISKLFESVDVGQGGVVLLRRTDNSKLVQRFPRNNLKDFNQPLPENNPIRQRIESGERSGTLKLIASTDGVERIASFKVLDDAPFYVQVAIAKKHYLASWQQGFVVTIVIAINLLLGFGFAIWRIHKSTAESRATASQIAYREAIFGGMFEQSEFLASVLDQSGRILEVNQTALKVIGLSREAVTGQIFADLPWWSKDKDRAALESSLQAAANGVSSNFEAVHPHIEGGEINVQCHVVPVQIENTHCITVTEIDITERKQAEQVVRDLLSRVQMLAEHLPGFVYQYQLMPDGSSAFPYASPGIKEIYGVTPEEVRLDASKVFAVLNPEDRERVAALITASAQSLEVWHDTYRVQLPDGRLLWVEGSATPNRQNDGSTLWHGYINDISTRKHNDDLLQRRSEALARSNAELEQFAYVVSHDLRQPLRMVNSYVQLLERRLDDKLDKETREMMHFATDGAKRMDQMLVSLLEYSRVGRKGEPLTPLESRTAVDEALHFLAPAIHEANAKIRVSGDWPALTASRDEFTRLWQNLIGNAVKYRAPERVPEIDITVTPENDDGWQFCVADNGIGIDPAQFDRLFKVFQRLHTRDQYEGTGIGLAVARKIVERHGGRLWVESAGAGQGCRFCFNLPKTQTAEVTR